MTDVRIGRSLPLPPGMVGDAEFSVDGHYRFWLVRSWDHRKKPTLVTIGTNPSSAGKDRDDSTIRVVENLAIRHGFGRLLMLNSDPLVSTDYGAVASDRSDLGRRARHENDRVLMLELSVTRRLPEDVILCAWGNIPTPRHMWLQDLVIGRRFQARCLGKTRNGRPRHPLRTQTQILYPFPYN